MSNSHLQLLACMKDELNQTILWSIHILWVDLILHKYNVHFTEWLLVLYEILEKNVFYLWIHDITRKALWGLVSVGWHVYFQFYWVFNLNSKVTSNKYFLGWEACFFFIEELAPISSSGSDQSWNLLITKHMPFEMGSIINVIHMSHLCKFLTSAHWYERN